MPITLHQSTYGRFAVKQGSLVLGVYSDKQAAVLKQLKLETRRVKNGE